MKHAVIFTAIFMTVGLPAASTVALGDSNDESAIRQRLELYVEAFNTNQAEAITSFWAIDGVSVAEVSGERTQGRDALQQEFAAFFSENSGARLTGDVDNVRMVRPDVAEVEGRTTLFIGDVEPVQSSFTAVLVKEGDEWLISSSHEHSLPQPATPYDALKELEWLIGTWQDQADDAQVVTSVRWSPNQVFLIRSFHAQFDESDAVQGTQVVGWDPLAQQIRTWTFNSDGSFGQGTVSRHDDQWMLKMTHILSDGRVAAATKVMNRVDENTLSVETIGATIDGEPVPSSEAVTVIRTDAPTVSESETSR